MKLSSHFEPRHKAFWRVGSKTRSMQSGEEARAAVLSFGNRAQDRAFEAES
jgi:hypothetical protein